MVILFHRRNSHFSVPRMFLVFGDLTFIFLAQLFAVFIRLGFIPGLGYIADHWPSLSISLLLYAIVFYAGGMYDPSLHRRRYDFDFLPLVVTLIAAALTGLTLYARPQMVLGRGIWLISTVLILLFIYLLRRIFQSLVRRGHFLKHAILLCDSSTRALEILSLLRRESTSPYIVKGIVTCDPASTPWPPPPDVFEATSAMLETPLPTDADDAPANPIPPPGRLSIPLDDLPPLLGDLASLPDQIEKYDVTSLLLSISAIRSRDILPQLRHVRYSGVEILDYLSLSEELRREIPLAYINDEWLMMAAMNSSILPIRRMKRIMDIAVSIIGLLPGIPLLLVAGVLVKLTSPGPMIYKQRRVGLGGRPYTLYKLRTMGQDAESHGAVWSTQKDMRVTPVGYYLRKWRLDEIPQLFNIIKGEMSLVGPRPERPEFTQQLATLIPFYNERTLVPPGLTGWAQVWFPYASSLEASARKLQYDLYYVKNMSFLLDISILLRTFKTIFVGLRHEDKSLLQTDDSPPPASTTM